MNATQAAIRAGYSAKTANANACRLMVNDGVKAAIEIGRKKIATEAGVTAERIVSEYAKLGFSNMADYMRVGADGDPYLNFAGLTRDREADRQSVVDQC